MEYRIVSLVPSLTELLFDLGLARRIVGRTGYCVHPRAEVARIPKVGGTKTVNLRRIRSLTPTHVLVNVDENRLQDVQALREFVPNVIVTHPCTPADNLALVSQMARAFRGEPGVLDAARDLRARLRRRLDALRAQAVAGQHPVQQVLYLIWREPWMTVARDTYISRMLELIAWHTWPDQGGGESGATRYPTVDWSEPWLARVQRVLLPSEPYAFTAADADELRVRLPHATVQQVDGELLSWYGSRSVAGLDYLAGLAGLASLPSVASAARPGAGPERTM